MKRDSLFGEAVLWSGRPKAVIVPTLYRGAAFVCGVTSAIATTSAVVVATALSARPGGLLAFAAWMATLTVFLSAGPKWWLSALEFVVTDKHIIVRRGKFRRFIDRKAVSFARIRWHKKQPGIGDLELVRAVPTGALRRRLTIVMHGLVAPDRVWAIIRGVTPAAPAGDGQRLLAQRLDEGERVLWSAHPEPTWRAWVPSGGRTFGSIVIALALAVATAFTAHHAVHALRTVASAGMAPNTPTFVALAASLSLAIVLLAGGSAAILYEAIVRPARQLSASRYMITDRRVLIQQGDEELHLDRGHIVDVIDAPSRGGLRDVFLVLDGPHARALAAGGAFGEAPQQGLQPVLRRIEDVDAVRRVLKAA
ncbi:MAG: hypothetical protein IPK82_02820 [Polyangiaceae bacterium]|nr:hypothetical protein [Polyangiaceae bacterium]